MPDEGQGGGALLERDEVPGGGAIVVRYEEARLRQLLPLLTRRAMAHSAMPIFDDHLIAAAKDFYGLEMDVAGVETEILEDDDERIRFFPWFLWDWRPDRERPGVGEHFLAEGTRGRLEERLALALCESYVGLYEALEDASASGVRLRELLTGQRVHLPDEGLEGELDAGEILLARLVRVRTPAPETAAIGEGAADEEIVLIDAVYAALPAAARPAIDSELAALPGPADVPPGTWPRAAFEASAPELMDRVERLLGSLYAPPPGSDDDPEPMMLAETVLSGESARALGTWIGTEEARDVLDETEDPALWLHRPDRDEPAGPGGDAQAFVLLLGPQRIKVGALSEEHLDVLAQDLLELAGVGLPHLKSLMDIPSAAARWSLGQGRGDAWVRALPLVARATTRWLERWMSGFSDLPQRVLGDLTPRQAVRWADGRQQVTRILDRVEALHRAPALAASDTLLVRDIDALRRQLLVD